jgi:hypothetical protein
VKFKCYQNSTNMLKVGVNGEGINTKDNINTNETMILRYRKGDVGHYS